MRRFNAHLVTGTADGITPGDPVSGNVVHLGSGSQKVADLSAVVTADAETNTLTLTPRWQVSNDQSTWYTVAGSPDNPATVPLATGTGGADAAVTRVLPAPAAAHAYQFARLQLVVGVVTGTSNDTYSIGYTYRVPRGQARRN